METKTGEEWGFILNLTFNALINKLSFLILSFCLRVSHSLLSLHLFLLTLPAMTRHVLISLVPCVCVWLYKACLEAGAINKGINNPLVEREVTINDAIYCHMWTKSRAAVVLVVPNVFIIPVKRFLKSIVGFTYLLALYIL